MPHSRYQTDFRKLYIHPTQYLRRFFLLYLNLPKLAFNIAKRL